MATIRIKFRASAAGTGVGTLFFQIIHGRVARQISTGYRLREAEWDGSRGEVLADDAPDDIRRDYLMSVNDGIRLGQKRLRQVIAELERSGTPFTADDVVSVYAEKVKAGGFIAFMRRHIEHLLKANKRAAARKVRCAMNSLLRFVGSRDKGQIKDDITYDELDSDLMEEYEGWLRNKGACMNTVSFYMRTLRSIYNIAHERGLTAVADPFKNVYTGVDKTVKRAVTLKVLAKIYRLDLTSKPELDFARDLFLLSFFLRGMSFVDLCLLKKSELVGGVLTYRRQKTGQLMQVKWEKPMQQLLKKFGRTDTIYLLPIIKEDGTDKRRQYENALRRENRNLKRIGGMIGLETPLTTYVARHSWASVAKSKNISINAISEGLGHNSVNTTKIYLASLDTSAVDEANNTVIGALCHEDE